MNKNATRPDVHVEYDRGVALVTLNNPRKRNALTAEMVDDLVGIAADLAASDAGCVVVRGAEGFFCSGADRDLLRSVAVDPAADEGYAVLGRVYEAFVRLGSVPMPVVAAVRGGAIGAGLNLALAADLRIVSDGARFLSGFRQLGIHPGGGHLYLLAASGGPDVAAAMGVFGLEMTGQQAAAAGLAWQALPDADVEARALELAHTIAADRQLSAQMIASLRRTTRGGWEAAVAAERAAQMWSLTRLRGSVAQS